MSLHRYLLLLTLLLVPACSSSPPDSGFSDVRQSIADRTGMIVQWDHDSADDRAVRDSVRALLAGKLTADQAVQIALLNNHNLQATFEDLGIAQADLVQAGLLKNPVFTLALRFPTAAPFGTYEDFSAAEDFLDIFLVPARQKLAQTQLEQAKAMVTSQVLTLAAQTRSAFYACEAAEKIVSLRRTIADTAAASAQTAQKLHDAGNNSDLDVLRAKLESTRAAADLSAAQSDADDSRERLNDLMGLWSEQISWTIAPDLPDLPTTEPTPPNLESLALRQRPDLAAAWQDVLAHAQSAGITNQTRLFSELNLGAEGERETDSQWRIGPTLSLPIPLFDQGQASVPRAQAIFRQSLQRYWALAVDVRSQVRAASNRMKNARTQALLYRDQLLPLQDQLVQETGLQFNAMTVGIFQLLEARRDQVDANRQYVNALRDYWTARADLELAIGGSLNPRHFPTSQPDSPTEGETP